VPVRRPIPRTHGVHALRGFDPRHTLGRRSDIQRIPGAATDHHDPGESGKRLPGLPQREIQDQPFGGTASSGWRAAEIGSACDVSIAGPATHVQQEKPRAGSPSGGRTPAMHHLWRSGCRSTGSPGRPSGAPVTDLSPRTGSPRLCLASTSRSYVSNGRVAPVAAQLAGPARGGSGL